MVMPDIDFLTLCITFDICRESRCQHGGHEILVMLDDAVSVEMWLVLLQLVDLAYATRSCMQLYRARATVNAMYPFDCFPVLLYHLVYREQFPHVIDFMTSIVSARMSTTETQHLHLTLLCNLCQCVGIRNKCSGANLTVQLT
jgi:hypothetical protein